MKYVFVHEAMRQTEEFEQVLAHERTHIRQKHSLDLLIVQLVAAFLWFNPLVWHLIKSLKTTHEYIADRKMITQGYSLVEYQTLLLRQLISNNSFGLVHNFNLSFIKKRITMMKNKKSGRIGRAKVALAVFTTIIFSGLIVQCNSNNGEPLDQHEETLASHDFVDDINLPVIPGSEFRLDGNPDDIVTFSISENRLAIDGVPYSLEEVQAMLEKSGLTKKGVVRIRVDRAQSMGFVRDVMWELRRADRRKLLYEGQTLEGKKVEIPFLLPPHPSGESGVPMPVLDEKYISENQLDLLKINMGDRSGISHQQQVYDFVQAHVKKGSSNYVISALYQDNDKFNQYLMSLVGLIEGFNQIYRERSQEMFGKELQDLQKEEYDAVRRGIPKAISIAEEG